MVSVQSSLSHEHADRSSLAETTSFAAGVSANVLSDSVPASPLALLRVAHANTVATQTATQGKRNFRAKQGATGPIILAVSYEKPSESAASARDLTVSRQASESRNAG
jgi:hypothetical protein